MTQETVYNVGVGRIKKVNQMNALTKSQLTSLLHNAYGFVDKHDVLFTPTVLTPNDEFELRCGNDVTLLFGFDNATFVNGTAVFETPDGYREYFTVVVVAVDSLNITAELLN